MGDLFSPGWLKQNQYPDSGIATDLRMSGFFSVLGHRNHPPFDMSPTIGTFLLHDCHSLYLNFSVFTFI